MRDKDLKRLEDELLVLCLDNCSIYLHADDRHYAENCRPQTDIVKPGKTSTWYACRLKVGSRTFMRIAKQACAKQLLKEKKIWRHRSFVRRLELTHLGENIAKRLKAERNDGFLEPEEDPLIKVRIWLQAPHAQEEPILIIRKEECLSSVAAVTLLREKADNEEYIITRSNTIVVTERCEELQEGNARKILVKGTKLTPSIYKRIKRLVRVTLNEEDLHFIFVPHTPLPSSKYLSAVKNLRTNQAQRMLKQWNCFKKPFS